MRKAFMVVALALALLGAIGFGSARSSAAYQPATAHTQLLASGSTPSVPVCGGGASTYCG